MLSRNFLYRLAEAPAYFLPANLARKIARRLYRWSFQMLGRASLQSTAGLLHLTLGEPRNDAWNIAMSCFEAKAQQRSNYRSMARTKDWRIAATRFPPKVFTALADSDKPLVILTLHQADYLAGLLAVLRLIPLEREIHIIKLAEWTQIEQDAYEHFRKYGHTLVIHRLSERPAKRIVRALKRKAILVTFVDVPREFGATAPVRMFGLPFQLTSGPLAMARLAGARVLPVFSNYADDNACEVQSGPMISVANKPSIEEMAQQLANQIESNLKRHPRQWEMWPVLQNLLDLDALAADYPTLPTPLVMRLAAVGLTPSSVNKQFASGGLTQNTAVNREAEDTVN